MSEPNIEALASSPNSSETRNVRKMDRRGESLPVCSVMPTEMRYLSEFLRVA